MIARITGNLIELDGEKNIVLLEVSDIAYELIDTLLENDFAVGYNDDLVGEILNLLENVGR